MFNHPEHAQTYQIKSVANTTGLSAHVIRKWEERYHLLHPQRGTNGYRLFTEDDIPISPVPEATTGFRNGSATWASKRHSIL